MKRMDDGRYNKVANIIGFTMQYHPHGDASIGDALISWDRRIFDRLPGTGAISLPVTVPQHPGILSKAYKICQRGAF